MPEGFRFCGQCGRALAATLQPGPGGVVTILFTDLQGFTTFTTRADQSAVRDLLLTYHGLVREQVERHGGFEVKQTGDGFMVAFSSAARAVRCAAGIQRMARDYEGELKKRLRVCAGINSGDVIEESGDFFGLTVNIASRLADRASAGQVLLAESTYDLAGDVDGLRCEDFGRRQLRGVQGRLRVFELVWWE
jgi:class 3 adenylate cyclase